MGSRASLEHDLVFFLEAYQQPYSETMRMPSSRRHRFVKIREEIVRNKGKGDGGGMPGPLATGLDPRPQQPMGPGGGT